MYRDNTLIPSEAVRLLALVILAGAEKRYGELAGEVRHFTSHVVGPSLELVASPLELLKVEGLIDAADGEEQRDEEREAGPSRRWGIVGGHCGKVPHPHLPDLTRTELAEEGEDLIRLVGEQLRLAARFDVETDDRLGI